MSITLPQVPLDFREFPLLNNNALVFSCIASDILWRNKTGLITSKEISSKASDVLSKEKGKKLKTTYKTGPGRVGKTIKRG